MNAFFDNPERIKWLRLVCDSWKGTAFKKWQRVKKRGVDCVQLAGAIYIECGVMPDFEPAPYTLDGGDHDERSAVRDWLEASPAFQEVDVADRQVGDLLCFRMNKLPHHVGILTHDFGAFFHCARFLGGTRYNTLKDSTFGSRLAEVWRPIKT